ncbi:prepilin-type N-terminal cleavage/methylation domain-containing protein [Pseudomonas sp. SCB32]|uniref:pilin n=1 Tax=Pseudomonas sp. SCB32 TaxID=2653853 RepID=UPI0012656E80|nr:prepilin-type N-terminal cleavage/methylation domain-containing protein [Pseudomonas sp. SCB32]
MKNVQRGFTLIELMIVVAIVGILASVSLPLYSDYSSRSRAAAAKTELSGVKTAVSLCMADAKLEECKAGTYGIPEVFAETSNIRGGYSVASGVIEANTAATDVDGNALTIKLTPAKDSKTGNITWEEKGTICNSERGMKPGYGDCPKTPKTGS